MSNTPSTNHLGSTKRYTLTAEYVDTCLPCYLLYGYGREGEALLYADLYGQTLEEGAADLLNSIDGWDEIPEAISDEDILEVLTEVCAGIDFRYIDENGERQDADAIPESTIVGYDETPLVYVVLRWVESNEAMANQSSNSCLGSTSEQPQSSNYHRTKSHEVTPPIVATFGDVDFINHGGQLLVPDADGDFYLEVSEPPTDDEAKNGDWLPCAKWTVYRVAIERFQVVERDCRVYLVCSEWKPDWPGGLASRDEWFHKYLDGIAESMDMDLAKLRSWFCSPSEVERAMAYIAVATEHGWYEFDQYPLTLTMHEVHERYHSRMD